ncbi:MAG TPA: hypothetical protein VIL97_07865, partial [Thermoanaerobaculia bacterium]
VGTALFAIGIVSVCYTALGGIAADIWSDVVQLALLWGGTLVAAIYLVARHGASLLDAIPNERLQPLILDASGIGDGATFAFWPMLLGGFFLYVSYYGCDQSQAQRILAADSHASARRALVWNGLLRFPLTLSYCIFGLLLAGLLTIDPQFAALVDGRPADSLVPIFITTYLPTGIRGLLIAAILAAAMSSIDSALNSLAAVTIEDVFDRRSTQSLWLGRLTALGWGLFAMVAGVAVSRSGAGILEIINQIGSAFYGPVLAVFLLGVLAPRVGGRAAVAGLVSGVFANLALARWAPGVSWLWWNPAGFSVASLVALLGSRSWFAMPRLEWPRRARAILVTAFLVMLAILVALS